MLARYTVPEGMPRPTGDKGQALLDMIWKHFSTHREWLTFDQIDRQLHRNGLVFEDAVQQLCPALLRGLSRDISQLPGGHRELELTLAGAVNAGGGSVIGVFLGMVRTAAAIEPQHRHPAFQPSLTPDDLRLVEGIDGGLLHSATMYAAAALGQHEPCFRGSGGFDRAKKTWTLHFDRSIRPFADVHRLEDYWETRTQVLGAVRVEHDNLPFADLRSDYDYVAPRRSGVPAVPAPAEETPKALRVECALHPLITDVAAARFSNGFYYDAVRSAFQAVEHRVQTLVGTKDVGERLMGIAFGNKPDPPKITVTRSMGGSLESEQSGMQFLFKGAMGALRNPRMHGPDEKDARDEAEEMLVFASFLMRRLDIEDEKRKAAASQP
ncbi:TIGR02391 family protein [Streptomyces sp. 1222.5]|uniref:TIGR02391 family protein n=1 Tax=Streptomyces sp. 1222.5 TaxID=1881026 RepID=UPI003EBBA0DC